ncbi:hypothetical protein FEM48_Zijuj07G0011700 [Ziziphus jujuba var. spinosa]|uniref:Uncharacterized protein n=1 Tax=Ziziphus jujuba var. spinosa TaxID=714518 RepID=A0A978V1K3_ZIZJJ|nr:hypothetical protein FEM48_Zijuj07G0011700 [Ziziphus jujuba var. spinosa]
MFFEFEFYEHNGAFRNSFFSPVDRGFKRREDMKLVTKGTEAEYSSTLYLVASIDLSDNNLSGHIPSEITRLFYLQTLNLSQNQLTGKIPSEVEKLTPPGVLDGQGNSGEVNYLHLSLGLGFAFGFWSVLGSLLINMPWTTALYGLLDTLVLKLYGIIFEYF